MRERSQGAEVLVRRDTGALTLGVARYAPGSSCPLHGHEEARVVVVLRGTFAEHHGARRLRHATPYLAIYRPPGEPHDEHYGPEGATCISVGLPARWPGDDGARLPAAPAERRGGVLRGCIDELDAEVAGWDGASALAVDALVLELAAALADGGAGVDPAGAGAAPRWWRRLEERLHDDFREPLSIARLAADVEVHPVHLARTFRARTGRTVGAFVRELRADWARAEVVRSRAPIASIAAAAGFSDESHLCRVMKRLSGRTPGSLRPAARR